MLESIVLLAQSGSYVGIQRITSCSSVGLDLLITVGSAAMF